MMQTLFSTSPTLTVDFFNSSSDFDKLNGGGMIDAWISSQTGCFLNCHIVRTTYRQYMVWKFQIDNHDFVCTAPSQCLLWKYHPARLSCYISVDERMNRGIKGILITARGFVCIFVRWVRSRRLALLQIEVSLHPDFSDHKPDQTPTLLGMRFRIDGSTIGTWPRYGGCA